MLAKKKTDLKLKYEMDKRGVSGVVVTIILIGITLSAITIVWSIVSNSLNRNLGKSQSCSDLFQKISLNRDYTCFDNLSRELHFSINIGDIMVDKIIIYVTSGANSGKFELTNTPHSITNVKPFGGNYGENVTLPGKNTGTTYVLNMPRAGLNEFPEEIQLVPVIDSNECPTIDAMRSIEDCRVFQ